MDAAAPPRMPGVTIAKAPPDCCRIAAISCGDATTPSSPAAWASPASATTWSSIGRPTLISASVLSVMLVSTVTAMTSERVPPVRAAVS